MATIHSKSHALHEVIGSIFSDIFSIRKDFPLVLDTACLPNEVEPSNDRVRQHIPLFIDEEKCEINRICDVDILVIDERKGQVSIVAEIE